MFVEDIIPLKTKIELSVSVEGLVAPIGVLKSFGSKKTLYKILLYLKNLELLLQNLVSHY